jgi:hypothetical protein
MPPITSISSVPPDYARSEPRARDRQRLATQVVEQVQRSVGPRASQPPLTDATQPQPRTTLRPPLDIVQRFFSERQAALREAALQRDEILQQQASDQPLRPIALAQREADRLQVLRDAQLLETQRLTAERVAPARDAERLVTQRETQRLEELRSEEQRLSEQLTQREDLTRLEEQRLQEEREAERLEQEEESERLAARRLEEEREQARVAQRQDAMRLQGLEEAERVRTAQDSARVETESGSNRLEVDRNESDRVLVERAALAYRSESERALSEATVARFEAEQPLSEQFRLARERLNALETRRIDRVDVSEVSFSRLAF